MITKLDEIITKIKEESPKRLSVACGEDPHTIEAVEKAVKEGIVKVVLTGDKNKIQKVAAEHNVDSSLFEIEDESDKKKALFMAISRVREGDCSFLMKGLIDSSVYMRGILDKERGLVTPGKLLSHVTVVEVPTYPKLLIVSDVAVIPYPELPQKIAMTTYTIDVAHKLGNPNPKVAIICAVEKVNPKMPPTLDAAVLCKMADRGQLNYAVVDGPLAIDLALSKESAQIKGVKSDVAGDADILIFPNIETGNVFFKTCTNLAKGRLAAIVTGAQCPCILTSRADSEDSKFYSIALGALVAK